MPKERKPRRFDPRFSVSVAALEAEAEHVRREFDNYSVLAANEVETMRVERYANCENTWRHLALVIESMPERDQKIVHALMFRDLLFVLELYKTYLHPICRELPPLPAVPTKPSDTSQQFSEFLFDVPARKE
jgi:hypothetical protein